MKKIFYIHFIFSISFSAFAEHLDLDKLLNSVKQAQSAEARINKQREAQFIADKNKQQQMLKQAQAELQKQERISSQLKAEIDSNEEVLSALETELKDKSGVLGELFGVVRQAAGDLKADLDHSLISAQFDERSNALVEIANSKELPTTQQLEYLWFTLMQEMTESGKVVYFNSQIQSEGQLKEAKVIRVGSFNAFADGKYLEYLADTERLNELAKQPDGKYLSMVEELFQAKKGPVTVGIDPTRGVILSMLIQAPDKIDRIKQGGYVGYLILLLGAVGFIYAITRWITLSLVGKKMQSQIESDQVDKDNPLGRIFIAAEQEKSANVDNLELVLDEAITREIPLLEKGLSMIKLLAAVAPLLGLLGTVTGMIATFQSISLFGTGDPKLMANGISQALVTTFLGLCVAIPLLFLHSLVSSRSKMLIQILDEQSAGLISRRLEK